MAKVQFKEEKMVLKRERVALPDQHQNFWQMASIQSAAFGIPVLNFGANLGIKHGPGPALITICIGNLLLWLVGLAIIAMTIKDRKNAIENFKDYIGKYGCWLAGFSLSLAFLFWFPLQIKGAMSGIKTVLEPYTNLTATFDIRIGTFLGLAIALLSIGGIKLIRWFNVLSFPLLLIFILYAVIKNASFPVFAGSWKISTSAFFSAVLASIAITLATVVNLPTFFRHRRSEVDAYFALSIFIFFTALIECLAVFLVNDQSGEFFTKYLNYNPFNTFLIILFLIVSMFCVNFTNIYFASAVWEAIFPWVSRSRELAIIGMGGTLTFVFFQAQEIMAYLESLLTTFIGILGIVMLIGYAIKKVVNHRERRLELFISTMCWMIGCFVAVLFQDIKLKHSTLSFFSGSGISTLLFIFVLFIEESLWAFKKIVSRKNWI